MKNDEVASPGSVYIHLNMYCRNEFYFCGFYLCVNAGKSSQTE